MPRFTKEELAKIKAGVTAVKATPKVKVPVTPKPKVAAPENWVSRLKKRVQKLLKGRTEQTTKELRKSISEAEINRLKGK